MAYNPNPQLTAQLTTISQREQELREVKEQLGKTKREIQEIQEPRIPERKLGSGVTKEYQKKVYEGRAELRREKAEKLKEIETKEKEIAGYEGQLSSARAQVEDALAEERAYYNAQKLFDKRISYYWVRGQKEYKYLKALYKQESLAKQSFYKQIADFEKANPTEKLIVDIKNLRVTGVESGALGKSISIENYNKAIEKYNAGIGSQNKLRQEQLKEVPKYTAKIEVKPEEYKPSTFGKVKDVIASLEGSFAPAGAFVPISTELESKRKFGVFLNPIDVYKDIQQQRKDVALAEKFNEVVSSAPESIRYDVYEAGKEKLKGEGVQILTKIDPEASKKLLDYTTEYYKTYGREISQEEYDIKKADLGVEKSFFVSKGLNLITPAERVLNAKFSLQNFGIDKTFNVPEKLAKPLKYATIGGGYLASQFFIFKGVGAGIGAVGKGAKATYTGLGGGLTLEGGRVLSNTGRVLATVSVAGAKGGKVAKVTKTGVTLGAIGTIGTLYTGGSIKEYQQFKEKGQTGLFVTKKVGELGAFGLVVGESLYASRIAKQQAKAIELKNYQRQLKAEQIKNIRDYGQYTKRAKFETKQFGVGKQVKLTPERLTEYSKIISKETGISEAQAKTVIKQASVYEQQLKVKSVLGDKFAFKKVGIDVSVAGDKVTKQLAFEFKQQGARISDFTIKTTVQGSNKGYALTNIFKKQKLTSKTPELTFKLDRVLATKVTKFNQKVLGEKTLSTFDFETRLIKGSKTLQKGGYSGLRAKEVLDIGLRDLKTDYIKKLYKDAGKVGAVDIGKGVRLEAPYYKGTKELKIALEGEFKFKQASRSQPSIATKNILKDVVFPENKKKVLKSKLDNLGDTTIKELSKDVVKTGTTGSGAPTGAQQIDKVLKTQIKSEGVSVNSILKDFQKTIRTRLVVQKSVSVPSVATASLTSLATLELSRSAVQQRQNQLVKQQQIQKTDQRQIQEFKEVLKTRLDLRFQQVLVPSIQTPTVTRPSSRNPPRPPTRTPTVPVGFDLEFEYLKEDIKKKGKSKTKSARAYTPDFTAKVLDISVDLPKSKKLRTKIEKKLLSTTFTGLEVRPGLVR